MPAVLVIDDDAWIRALVRDLLTIEGYDVQVAEDGVGGLALVEAFPPDCVVLDVMMPGMDGFEVLAALRERVGADLPVVMLTAAADDEQAWKAWTGGVDYFLAKPFAPDDLLRYLDYLFGGTARPDDAVAV